jgi:hypothetical protein
MPITFHIVYVFSLPNLKQITHNPCIAILAFERWFVFIFAEKLQHLTFGDSARSSATTCLTNRCDVFKQSDDDDFPFTLSIVLSKDNINKICMYVYSPNIAHLFPSQFSSLDWIDVYPSLFLLEDRNNFRSANNLNMIPIDGNEMMSMTVATSLTHLSNVYKFHSTNCSKNYPHLSSRVCTIGQSGRSTRDLDT